MTRDYSKLIIYKLVNIFDKHEKMIYICTTTNWVVRRYQHKRRCQDIHDKGYNWKIYKYIRQTGGMENWKMVKIEEYPCNNSLEASRKERFFIEYYNAKLNTMLPIE